TLDFLEELKPWLEKERMLPVWEANKANSRKRIGELEKEIADIDAEISEKLAEADRELPAMDGMEDLRGKVAILKADARNAQEAVDACRMRIGGLMQKKEQAEALKKEIRDLQEQQAEASKEQTDYETLKAAFSQSGIPHQIIRSIIPQLTATANSILGQMTGGKMGVEFRLERKQMNGKEKAALDIFIEESGKHPLPYLSKSGGEKVKSSLSVILALAEVKSTTAGVQLGMLFIDEAPFLDADGVTAYCDALETIQRRYKDIKVMAITHDPSFKMRFPQSVTVYKDEHGSHVVGD
ncbi:MAG: hypothetical protein LIO47_09865, partial [Akkermansia sp.]|nr:hypothetical protein [Akkermansia sp.]